MNTSVTLHDSVILIFSTAVSLPDGTVLRFPDEKGLFSHGNLTLPYSISFVNNRGKKQQNNCKLLVNNIAFLRRNVALLVRNVAFLRRNVALLVRNVAFLRRNVALLVRKVAFLRRNGALLVRNSAFLRRNDTFLVKKIKEMTGQFCHSFTIYFSNLNH